MNTRIVLTLTTMGISAAVVANNLSALNVALPSIERTFDSEITTVQWVINAYLLSAAMLIATGGRLADTFGRRRIFLIGMAIFVGSSLIGGSRLLRGG